MGCAIPFAIAPIAKDHTGKRAKKWNFSGVNYNDLGGGDLQDEVYAAHFLAI